MQFIFLTIFSVLLIFCTQTAAVAYDIVNGSPDNPFPSATRPTSGRTEAIGGYSGGCLSGGVTLPHQGPGYFLMRTSRNRFYGHQQMFDFIHHFSERSLSNPFLIGDIAQPRGGPTNTLHVSHQSGLDVDIWFQRREHYNPQLPPNWRETINARSVVHGPTQTLNPYWDEQLEPLLLWAISRSEVDRVFVNAVIKKHFCLKYPGHHSLNKLRPWYGHDDHFHVRLKCESKDSECQSQTPVPDDKGCGAELDWWFSDEARNPPSSDEPIVFRLPERCRDIANSID